MIPTTWVGRRPEVEATSAERKLFVKVVTASPVGKVPENCATIVGEGLEL